MKAAERVFYALIDHSIPNNPASVRNPEIFQRQESVLFSVYDYILEAFNKGGYKPSLLHDTEDTSFRTWQNLSDKAYEMSVALRKSSIDEAAEAFDWILRNLEPMAKSNHPSMMIKFWRVCYYLKEVGGMINNYGHLYNFIGWLHALAEAERPSNTSIVRLLGALKCMDGDALWYTLRIGYLRSIHCFQTVLKSRNDPSVLSMWANYSKHWCERPEKCDAIIVEFQKALAEAESQIPPNVEREIFVLHGFAYFTFYITQDHFLSMPLLTRLLNKTTRFIQEKEVLTWQFETQAFCFASKSIAILLKTDASELAATYMMRAVAMMRNGDRECRARAWVLNDELINWNAEMNPI